MASKNPKSQVQKQKESIVIKKETKKQAKKQTREKLFQLLQGGLAEYATTIGEKRYQRIIDKTSRKLADHFSKAKKSKSAIKESPSN